MELDIEIKSFLNELIGLTLSIANIYKNIYEKLLKNEDSTENINKLKTLINKEKKYYEYLNDNIEICMIILDYFSKKKLTSYNNEDVMTYERILHSLEKVFFLYSADNPSNIFQIGNNSNAQNLLINNGFSEDEAKSIIIKACILIEESVAIATNNLDIQAIKNSNNSYIKQIYIMRNLKNSMYLSGDFEQELINNKFSFVNNYMARKLKELLKTNGKVKQQLLNFLLEKDMDNTIKSIMIASDAEVFDAYFMHFKAIILHLDEEELNRYKNIITNEALIKNYNPKNLINYIDYIIKLRKEAKGKNK